MSNKTPEENDAATAWEHKHPHKSRPQKVAFWGSRVLEAYLPGTMPRKQKQAHQTNLPRQDWTRYLPLIIFVMVVGSVLILQQSLKKPSVDCSFKIPKPVKGTIPGRPVDCIKLEVAQTPSAVLRGLSGRASMPRDQGMLFVFGEPGEECMWMKDMRFSLDMLWLDANKQVVHIERDVGPDTYPHPFCAENTKYVVEVNAGTADAAGIQVGQHLNL